MAKTKKTTKRSDCRKRNEWYETYSLPKLEEFTTTVVSRLSRGFIDYRALMKRLNSKAVTAIETSAPALEVSTDEQDLKVTVTLKEVVYSRAGIIYRLYIETDDRVTGAFTKEFKTVTSYYNSGYNSTAKDVASAIKNIHFTMIRTLEDTFNNALYNAGLAPTNETLYYNED